MKYNLFLDDIRVPSDVTWIELPEVEWKIVRNYDEFVNIICSFGMPELISFDHDLSFEHYPQTKEDYSEKIDYSKYSEKTGYDCAKWLVSECQKLGVKHPPYVVHSMNPVGVKNIISYVESYNRTV